MLSTHNDRFIAPFKRDSAAEERAIEPDDSSSRSIFGDSATASNSGCNSRESIAPVSDSLHPQRQTQRTKLEHLGFLITLSTHVFCLQILVPPSPEYVSPICDLHTGRGRDRGGRVRSSNGRVVGHTTGKCVQKSFISPRFWSGSSLLKFLPQGKMRRLVGAR